MPKKLFLLFLSLLFIIITLSGCGKKETDMKTPQADGGYVYTNQDLGFKLRLPKEFLYYQVQRKNQTNFIDIEIFVPTNDTSYPQEVPSYAKPVVIRIYEKEKYESLAAGERWKKVMESNERIYGIKFWDKTPKDWQNKWNDKIKNDIEKSLEKM